ncbi:MAG: hypothetical protein ACRC92_25090 [Peptostreptococcaceae bacterium]
MKKIYVITTYTGTVLSYMIRNFSKTPYAHVSIALNEDLRPMYSFGRLNPKTPIFAGFVEENINEGLYAIRQNTMCRVYSLEVTDSQYEKLKENIDKVSSHRTEYDYDVRGLVRLSINKPRQKDYKYVCSNFVADMLVKSNINILEKPSHEVRPNDFYDLDKFTLEYEGLLSKYGMDDHTYLGEMAKA